MIIFDDKTRVEKIIVEFSDENERRSKISKSNLV